MDAGRYLDQSGVHRLASVDPSAGGQVVLCAGAVGTPALMLVSGVGAAGALASHGIKTEVELPGVGQNLADQPAVTTGSKIPTKTAITDRLLLKGTQIPRHHGGHSRSGGRAKLDLGNSYVYECSLGGDI